MQSSTESMIAALEGAIPSLMQEAAIPGLSIAIVRDGRILWNRGFGVKQAGTSRLVDTCTVFEGASFSKPLFAYGVLCLARSGLLDLDTPLTEYLPDRLFCSDPRIDSITVRMVLSHTTGFPNWRRADQPMTLDRTPGESFGYSGEGYVYLQQVVEHLSGQLLHEYMQQMVLSPLGMMESSYVWRESYESEAAIGHKSDGTPYAKEAPATANAAASLHTTPSDFTQYLAHVLDLESYQPGGSGVDVHAMMTPQVHVAGNLWWGLGWGLQQEGDDEIIWHWGDNPGFTNFVAAKRRERSGVVMMTNSDNGLRAWETVACSVLGLNRGIFDWLTEAFYGGRSLTEAQLRGA